MKIGITGGIGSGKSYVCRLLNRRGIEIYDCDRAAKRLIRTSMDIRRQLTALIGRDAYNGEELNKAAVARFLLESENNAKAIDNIVHPAVFKDFEKSSQEWMESAIMFESGIYKLIDKVVVVTAPEDIRIQRVMERDGITSEEVRQWMQRQWPQEIVRLRADYEIVNDGNMDLEKQIDNLLIQIKQL